MINENMFLLKKNGEPRKHKCYCRSPELIENYGKAIADETQVWEVHHRREEFYSCAELIERGEYFDVEPSELIFLTRDEHRKIDSKCKRHSEAMKGHKPHNNKNVLCVETGETFDSIADAERKTGIARPNISKVLSGKRKTAGGFHWRYV